AGRGRHITRCGARARSRDRGEPRPAATHDEAPAHPQRLRDGARLDSGAGERNAARVLEEPRAQRGGRGLSREAAAAVSLIPPFGSSVPKRPTYWLTRFVILRLLGFVYFFAFLSLARQVLPLIGSHGLTPVGQFLENARQYHGSTWSGFRHYPSLFWLDDFDPLLSRLAWTGLALSVPLSIGYANAILLTVLWALYMS